MRRLIRIVLLIALFWIAILGMVAALILIAISLESMKIYGVLIGIVMLSWLTIVGLSLLLKAAKTIVTP